MRRRSFIRKSTALLGGLAGISALPNSAFALKGKKQRWRLALGVPKTLPIWGPGVERFAKNVEILTEGFLHIKVYGAGELVPALGTFDSVKAGEIQMSQSAAYYWQGKIPATPFFTAIPFGMDTVGMLAWLQSGGGQELYNEMMTPHGVVCMPCGTTGFQMGGWFNKEIRSLEDLKGLKIRIPGLASKVFSKAGAKPVLLPGGEIFTGISTGVVDAVEWSGPYHDYTMGFHKAAKYYYGSCWADLGAILELMVNKQAWDTLPPGAQLAVRIAADETTAWMHSQSIAKNSEYLVKLKQEGRTEMRTFPEPVLSALRQYTHEALQEIAATSPLAKRIHDSFFGFKKSYEAFQNFAGGYYYSSMK